MNTLEEEQFEYVILEPDGRLVLPEHIMNQYVMQPLGCRLWFNDKDQALGIRLLRGVDDPPYLIDRRPKSGGGEEGVLK
ncbi:MAG: hypothetical protein V1742_05605, partial [Pseudomonadota bacterium]